MGCYKYSVAGTVKYKLENIYNKNTIEFTLNTLKRIKEGKTTISKILCLKAYDEKSKNNLPFKISHVESRRKDLSRHFRHLELVKRSKGL